MGEAPLSSPAAQSKPAIYLPALHDRSELAGAAAKAAPPPTKQLSRSTAAPRCCRLSRAPSGSVQAVTQRGSRRQTGDARPWRRRRRPLPPASPGQAELIFLH